MDRALICKTHSVIPKDIGTMKNDCVRHYKQQK